MSTKHNKMNGQKLADWQTELSTCVYNQLKKAKITMGLLHALKYDIEPNEKQKNKIEGEIGGDETIEQVETFLNKNIKQTSGFIYVFNFDQDEIAHIFNGDVEIRYEEDDNEHFVPTVYLGMKPQTAKVKKSISSTSSKEDKFQIEDGVVQINMAKMTPKDYLSLSKDYLSQIAKNIGVDRDSDKNTLVYRIIKSQSKKIVEFELDEVDNIGSLLEDMNNLANNKDLTTSKFKDELGEIRNRIVELKGFLENPKKILKRLDNLLMKNLTYDQYIDEFSDFWGILDNIEKEEKRTPF